MKTAVSIPDDLFADAERFAQRMKRSRSRLFTDAIREYLARHDPAAITAALNRVYGDEDEARLEAAISAASVQTLRSVEG
jgi:metal-responsive CopG/Arc/MetJ family transcriptional regulator